MLRSSWILNECNLYVIGLHAVQFGHNWIKKNSGDSQNWTRPQAESSLAVRGIFFQSGQACSPLTY